MLSDAEIKAIEYAFDICEFQGEWGTAKNLRAIVDRERKRKEQNLLRDRMERAEAIG